MAYNKVIYGGNTLIDLTSDTITTDKLAQGYTAHDRTGAIIIGTATGGGDAPIWQGADDYVYVSDTAAAPVEIYTDDGYVVLDIAPPTLNLQTKSVTYTASTTAVTDMVTADNGYDGLDKVNVTVSALTDGNDMEYGITDGTIPRAGIAKADYSVI